MKKIISIVLAVSLIATLFCGISFTASAEETNLITNGDFSNELNGWTVLDQPEGSTATGKTFIHPGWSGFNATAPYLCMEDYDAGVSQSVSLTAGCYRIGYKFSGTGTNSSFKVMVNDGKGNNLLWEEVAVTRHSKFTSAYKTFVLSEDAANAYVRFTTEDASAQVLFDDIVLSKVGDERILNGDFSDGFTGFTASNTTIANNAANILYWSKKGEGLVQNIPLIKGEAYQLKFDIASVGNEAADRMVYAVVTSGDKVIAETSSKAIKTANTWKEVTLKFFADETYGNAAINIYIPSNSTNNAGTYVDNISVKKIDLDGELVYNQSFNKVLANYGPNAGWTIGWADVIAADNSIKLWWENQANLSTTIALEEGKTYKLDYLWRMASDRKLPLKVSVTIDGVSILSETWETYGTGSQFVGRGYIFDSTKTGIATLTISGNGCNDGYIKGVSVKKVNHSIEFNSETVTMKDNYIYGATDVESVLSAFTLSENATVVCTSEVVATGVKIIVRIDNIDYKVYDLVVKGDATGDGACNILDLVAAKKQAVGMNRLSGAYLRAVSSGENVSADDLTTLRKQLLTGF